MRGICVDKLKAFAKKIRKEEEVEWPIGTFKVKGTYARPKEDDEHDYTEHDFDDIITIDVDDYDCDSGFPCDEFDRIVQEKCEGNLPSNHFDLTVEETEQID